MKWKANSKVPEATREKIETIISNFNAFIKQTHGAAETDEDEKVFKGWKQFKELLQNNPDDMDSHHEFISKMSQIAKSRDSKSKNLIKKTVSSSQLNLGKSVHNRSKSREYELDKEKLKNSIHSFLGILEKNNRQILKI